MDGTQQVVCLQLITYIVAYSIRYYCRSEKSCPKLISSLLLDIYRLHSLSPVLSGKCSDLLQHAVSMATNKHATRYHYVIDV